MNYTSYRCQQATDRFVRLYCWRSCPAEFARTLWRGDIKVGPILSGQTSYVYVNSYTCMYAILARDECTILNTQACSPYVYSPWYIHSRVKPDEGLLQPKWLLSNNSISIMITTVSLREPHGSVMRTLHVGYAHDSFYGWFHFLILIKYYR